MGKRSSYERVERDYYPTPLEAVEPLIPFLKPCTNFIEPCAGDGRLIRHLESFGHKCVYACDIEPQAEGIEKRDILFFGQKLPPCDMVITNTPWERSVLHPMIELFREHAPTWLLFDADWLHTIQAADYLPYCRKIVSIGRVKWIEGSESSGMDNAMWALFTNIRSNHDTQFYGRGIR